MSDFNALLDRQGSSFEKPKPLPAGHYEGTISKLITKEVNVKNRETGDMEKRTLGEMFVRATSAGEDVDADALEAYGGLSARSTLRHTWWLEEDSMHEFISFCENVLGFDADNTVREHIDAVAGNGLLFECINVPDQNDSEKVYANIAKNGFAAL